MAQAFARSHSTVRAGCALLSSTQVALETLRVCNDDGEELCCDQAGKREQSKNVVHDSAPRGQSPWSVQSLFACRSSRDRPFGNCYRSASGGEER
jgi:hypothetical protein